MLAAVAAWAVATVVMVELVDEAARTVGWVVLMAGGAIQAETVVEVLVEARAAGRAWAGWAARAARWVGAVMERATLQR